MTQTVSIRSGSSQEIHAIYNCPEQDIGPGFRIENTLVIMVHDFPGSKSGNNDLFADLEYQLGLQGHHTIRFDFRGCGDSDGAQEQFTLGGANEDLQAVKHWAKRKGYGSFAFIAEGIGASVAAMNVDRSFCAMLLFWPVLDLKSYGERVFKAREMQEKNPNSHFVEVDGERISSILINEMFKIDLQNALKEVCMPVLVFHGVQDKKIPIDQLDILRNTVTARRIEITSFQDGEEGLQKLNHRKAIFYQTQQFVDRYA